MIFGWFSLSIGIAGVCEGVLSASLSFNLKLVGRVRMYIGVTIKRYRAVKEVGRIKMSVGIITYYQLIQVCQVKNDFLHIIS